MTETCLRLPGNSALSACEGSVGEGPDTHGLAPRCQVCGRALSYVGKWVYEEPDEPMMLAHVKAA